uniref:Uncharacterized protein n=1 Tax=Anguilla anguilla TaxID=7936 RepID=A0A0E9PUK0_ANGAN
MSTSARMNSERHIPTTCGTVQEKHWPLCGMDMRLYGMVMKYMVWRRYRTKARPLLFIITELFQ